MFMTLLSIHISLLTHQKLILSLIKHFFCWFNFLTGERAVVISKIINSFPSQNHFRLISPSLWLKFFLFWILYLLLFKLLKNGWEIFPLKIFYVSWIIILHWLFYLLIKELFIKNKRKLIYFKKLKKSLKNNKIKAFLIIINKIHVELLEVKRISL